MMVSGWMECYMVMELSHGLMEEFIKENLNKIRKMVKVPIHGLMVKNMMVAGSKVNNTEKHFSQTHEVKLEKEDGNRARGKNGSTIYLVQIQK